MHDHFIFHGHYLAMISLFQDAELSRIGAQVRYIVQLFISYAPQFEAPVNIARGIVVGGGDFGIVHYRTRDDAVHSLSIRIRVRDKRPAWP
ncbi:hypothetical protein ARMGADRAFT_54727 [Armillaria gallica]|uniref:Uncharacterized protein n=1 Tax=Armillaria gallica TaxID=47427 RepID=A0A2H3EYT2_ARMGA|nr:hypothetical protein ARMGADRAFT_54727 [Armillaria gallica]